MNTEEDTFKTLRRQPFSKIRERVRISHESGIPTRIVIRMIKSAGWTPRDYMDQLAKEVNK